MAPFQPYADKPTVMSYHRCPEDVLESPPELIAWSEESLARIIHERE